MTCAKFRNRNINSISISNGFKLSLKYVSETVLSHKHELWVSGDTSRGIHFITTLKIESRHDAKFLDTNDYTFGIVGTRCFQYMKVKRISVMCSVYVHRETHKDHILATGFVLSNSAMMTSSNGNNVRFIGPLCGESIGHRWIPLTKASDTELWCFLWSAPEQTVERTIETPVTWDAIALIITSL